MKIVVLTGAGISAESGLGTFRDVDGLWTKFDLEEVATPEGFERNPSFVHDFYNARRRNCNIAAPNAAHDALARLENAIPGQLQIVTQNIDDLHERAGSRAVLHMHGSILGAMCASCDHRWSAPAQMESTDLCPSCQMQATRPDVVWFGEMPYHMPAIEAALQVADLFVSIGTSGTVYPAAGFAQMAMAFGVRTVELNLEPSGGGVFDEVRQGPASVVVPAWVDEMLRAT